MTNFTFTRFALSSAFAFFLLSASAAALNGPGPKRKLNVPPSADLSYSIKARQSGLTLSGDALVQWRAADQKFTVMTETRAMLIGKILEAKSEGAIDEYGLAPVTFTEKRFRKDRTTTSFDRQAKEISFSTSGEIYPIQGGEQDRSSAIWQLISIARTEQAKFKAGSEWTFFVAGQHDGEAWSFKVSKSETISTPLGDISAVHVLKAPPPDAKGQQLDIWLAPALEWYPVRLRFTEANGDLIEQSLVTINKTSS